MIIILGSPYEALLPGPKWYYKAYPGTFEGHQGEARNPQGQETPEETRVIPEALQVP